jgi:hypothetical protein
MKGVVLAGGLGTRLRPLTQITNPPDVFDIIQTLKPSGRGELEITDVTLCWGWGPEGSPRSFLGYACVDYHYVNAQRLRPSLLVGVVVSDALSLRLSGESILLLQCATVHRCVECFTCSTSEHNALHSVVNVQVYFTMFEPIWRYRDPEGSPVEMEGGWGALWAPPGLEILRLAQPNSVRRPDRVGYRGQVG